MTILSRLYPEVYWSQYGGYYGWGSDEQQRGWNYSSWDSIFNFREAPRNRRMNGVSIPIIFDDDNTEASFHDYHELSDSDSNSDSDDDVNQNSLPMRRKRRYEWVQEQSPVSPDENEKGGSQDLPSPSKQKLKNGSSKLPSGSKDVCDAGTSSRRQYNTRSKPVATSDIIFLEDDECEINEITSYEVYTHLKKLLQKCGRCIDEMRGDGNCFFRALSKVVYGNQKFYDDIRQAVVDLIAKYPKRFEAVTDGPVSSHVADMRQDKTWATQTEIYAAATLLCRPIYILSPDQKGDNYKWLLFSPLFKYNTGKVDDPCHITICHTHGNHYDRIAPLNGKCNCALDPPELSGFKGSVDLTVDENEIV